MTESVGKGPWAKGDEILANSTETCACGYPIAECHDVKQKSKDHGHLELVDLAVFRVILAAQSKPKEEFEQIVSDCLSYYQLECKMDAVLALAEDQVKSLPEELRYGIAAMTLENTGSAFRKIFAKHYDGFFPVKKEPEPTKN